MEPRLAVALKDVDPAALGRRLRDARIGKGLTQGQMAESIASVGYVSRIESGQRRPDPSVLERLADRLDADLDQLILGVTRDELASLELQLDYAELSLASGEAAAASTAVEALLAAMPATAPVALQRRARFLRARTLEATGSLDEAIALLEDLLGSGPQDLLWLQAGIALSRCYRESGDLSRAIVCGEEALRQLQAAGLEGSDESVQLAVTVAAAHFENGDTGHAVRVCRRAVQRAEEIDSPTARASAYWNASAMEFRRGSVAAALPLARRALATLESGSDSRNIARLRNLLGLLLMRLDPPELEEARAALEQAARELDWSSASVVDVARNQIALARAAFLDGDLDGAATRVRSELARLQDRAPLLAADATALLGQVAVAAGDPSAAREYFQRAVGTLTGIGADRGAAQLWFDLGDLLDSVGDGNGARDCYKRAAASAGLSASRSPSGVLG